MAPLRSRFGIVHRLEFYSAEDILQIVQRSAKILGIKMDEEGAREIARRSRGTPRVANRLLRRVRDFAEVRAKGHINIAVARDALAMLGIDEHGLDEVDRNLLLTIIQKYSGGPVGLNTIAASLSEEEDAIEEIYEPYLMQLGLLDRTQRGRVATALAYKHFGHGGTSPPTWTIQLNTIRYFVRSRLIISRAYGGNLLYLWVQIKETGRSTSLALLRLSRSMAWTLFRNRPFMKPNLLKPVRRPGF